MANRALDDLWRSFPRWGDDRHLCRRRPVQAAVVDVVGLLVEEPPLGLLPAAPAEPASAAVARALPRGGHPVAVAAAIVAVGV